MHLCAGGISTRSHPARPETLGVYRGSEATAPSEIGRELRAASGQKQTFKVGKAHLAAAYAWRAGSFIEKRPPFFRSR